MGCGQTLAVVIGAGLVCAHPGCPDPQRLASILADSETEHVVTFTGSDWSVLHPLRERAEGELFDCPVVRYLSRYGPPDDLADAVGKFRLIRSHEAIDSTVSVSHRLDFDYWTYIPL